MIGNAAYPDGDDLANPVNDATDLGAKLKGYGFEVIVAADVNAKEMEKRLKEFRKLLETHEVGLFFPEPGAAFDIGKEKRHRPSRG